MTLFGYPIETIYLIMLIISGGITILYVFFGDVLEGADEISPFLSPVLILAFVTFFSASGYILEKVTTLQSWVIIAIAIFIALVLDILLNFFVLVPLKSAEQSLSYSEKSLEGRVGKTIVSIPKDGFGEVVIENYSGVISKPATSYENTPIPDGQDVLVIEVKNGVLHVVPYEPTFK